MLQRCDTESITLGGITGGIEGRRGGGERRIHADRQNHIRMNHTRAHAHVTKLHERVGRNGCLASCSVNGVCSRRRPVNQDACGDEGGRGGGTEKCGAGEKHTR
jgi:hypothetical protein